MLNIEDTALVVVDMQEKLVRVMHDMETLVQSAVKLIKGAQVLGLPILWTEQNPEGLGPTIPEIAELLTDLRPVTKLSFSCCGEASFEEELETLGREQILIAGIESHVCVYQTAADLLDMGFDVEVVSDAVASRTPENKRIGLDKCREYGASITSVETALFELIQGAEGPQFKELIKIVK
ncbi:MAG: hydrolase [Desulfomonile sp.]|nr:hydrolase [Desulfomonile sp.]